MVVLEEDIVSPECDEVYYQTPEELKVKHDPEPDVVHDDSNSYEDRENDYEEEDHQEEHEDDDDDDEYEEDDEKEYEPQCEEEVPVPSELTHDDHHGHHHHDHHCDGFDHHCHHHDHYCDITPIEAIRRAKCCPSSVCISKLNGKYYIDHNDLRCYMDACGESNYESALNNIIAAHDKEDLCSDNIGIVMGESDLLKLDPETKLAMESSSVSFEVYK